MRVLCQVCMDKHNAICDSVLCHCPLSIHVQAYHMNLTTPNHLWMFPAWFTEGWWNDTDGYEDPNNMYRCTRDQVSQYMHMHTCLYPPVAL